ncbi:MAG: DsrH/TusB family sulfur metabolism protein [Pseudomonadota bacterium]
MAVDPTATLHLVFSSEGLTQCRARCAAGDFIVLCENGVYTAGRIGDLPVPCHLLAEDAAQRGVDDPGGPVTPIDRTQLVALTLATARSVSWR